MPLFGKKKEEIPIINKPHFVQHSQHLVNGPTSCLALDRIQGKDAVIASALNSRGFTVTGVDGKVIWTFNTKATVYSLAVANSGDRKIIFAGSGGNVFAISEEGTELWRYQMPKAQSRMDIFATNLARRLAESQNRIGYNDVYHLAAGKLENQDVVIAVGGGEYISEGAQVISTDGKLVCVPKRRVLGSEHPHMVHTCMLTLSPNGDSILAVVGTGSFGMPKADAILTSGLTTLRSFKAKVKISVLSKEGKVKQELKTEIEMGIKDRYTVGGFQDKYRGKLVAGRLDTVEAALIGNPNTRSVTAVSLEGRTLWNYIASPYGEIDAGINDIAIGSFNGQSVVIIGTFDHFVHLVSGNGQRLEVWQFPSNVNNVAYGSIGGKDGFAVGLYNGQIMTYKLL